MSPNPKPCSPQDEAFPNDGFIVPFSRKKIFLLFGGAVLFVVAGFWLLSIADEQTRHSPTFLKVVGISAIVFFGLCAAYSIFKLFDSKPALVILENGFYDNSSAIAGEIIPWRTVTEIGVTTISSQRFLTIKVENPEEIIKRFKPPKRWLIRLNYRSFGTPLHISANALNMDFDALVSIMQEKYEAYLKTVGRHPE